MGKVKEISFKLCERKNVEENLGLELKLALTSGKIGSHKSSCTSSTSVSDEYLQVPFFFM